MERMRELVRDHGADDATRDAIRSEVRAATEALGVFDDGAAKIDLTTLAEREVARLG
ncbi:MAG: hypothetical protein U5J97_03950 [Trueperaceae bacterium]|nr:hypothetical protein [Trueperaceae bacterium]